MFLLIIKPKKILNMSFLIRQHSNMVILYHLRAAGRRHTAHLRALRRFLSIGLHPLGELLLGALGEQDGKSGRHCC